MKTLNPAINTQIKRRVGTEARPLRYSVLTVICGSVLIAGFFFAARQHFSSIDYGFKNSRLRMQVDQLEAEKRRLLLAKEISISPVELMKAQKRVTYASAIPARAGSHDKGDQTIRTVRTATPTPAVQKTGSSKPSGIAAARKFEKKEGTAKDPRDRS